MAGLTSTGFTRKILSEIKKEIEDTLRSTLGAGINVTPPSVIGTLIGAIAEREDLLWQEMENVYNSQYPGTAVGTSLDNVVALTGISRLAATKSVQYNLHLFGTAGTVVPAGTIVSVSGNPQARFITDNSATLVAGVDEVQTLSFSATPDGGSFKLKYEEEETGLINQTATASTVQTALNALNKLSGVIVTGSFGSGFTITFAGNDGKIDHPILEVTSNTLLIGITAVTTSVVQTTQGVPQATVNCTAETAGEVEAIENTLTVIETPIAGLDRVRNMEDAIVGRNLETDNELRIRREQTLQVAGAGTLDAIRSSLLNLVGVTSVLMFENKTLVTDIDGRPGKSYEAVVQGGLPADITQKVWDTKPAGIETFGNQTGIATDSQNIPQTVKWSRPTEVNIWVELDVTDGAGFPLNGATLIRDAIIEHINGLGIGQDIIVVPKLLCAIGDIAGIEDVVVRIGTSASPTLDNNIPIAPAQIAVTDSSKITVTIL